MDEATQSNEQETLIPLMLGVSKLVLVGDPAQLPATVLSTVKSLINFTKTSTVKLFFSGSKESRIRSVVICKTSELFRAFT